MPRAITVTGLLVTNASNTESSIFNPPPNIFHKLDFPSFMVYFERVAVQLSLLSEVKSYCYHLERAGVLTVTASCIGAL